MTDWQDLVASASLAVDHYVADQTRRFGGVTTIQTNVILDRMGVPSTGLARKAVAQELRARGWEPDQARRSHSWHREGVIA